MQPLKSAMPAFLSATCANGAGSREVDAPISGPGTQAQEAHKHTSTGGQGRAGQGRAAAASGRPLLGWDSSNEAAHRRDVAVGLQHRGRARALSCNVVGWSAGGCAGGQGSLSARHAMAPARACVIGRPMCSPPIFDIASCPALPACPPVPSQVCWVGGDGFGWRSAGDQILLLCGAGGDGPKEGSRRLTIN